jgi:hypothetical protein
VGAGAATPLEAPKLSQEIRRDPGLIYGVHVKPRGVRGWGIDRAELLKTVRNELGPGAHPAHEHLTVDHLNDKLGMLPPPGRSAGLPALPAARQAELSHLEQLHYAHQHRVEARFTADGQPAQAALPYEQAVMRNNKAAMTMGVPVHFNLDGLRKDVTDRAGGRFPDAFTSSEARFAQRNIDRLTDVRYYSSGRRIDTEQARKILGQPESPRPPSAQFDPMFFAPPRRAPVAAAGPRSRTHDPLPPLQHRPGKSASAAGSAGAPGPAFEARRRAAPSMVVSGMRLRPALEPIAEQARPVAKPMSAIERRAAVAKAVQAGSTRVGVGDKALALRGKAFHVPPLVKS